MCDEIKSLVCPKCGSVNNLVHHLVDHEGWNEEDARMAHPHFVCNNCFHDCPTSEVGGEVKGLTRKEQKRAAYLQVTRKEGR
jgi:uncharacterized protein (DUF2132 family)